MFTILVTFLTVIADQITKYFVCINMDLGETIPVIKNVVHLTYIINPGRHLAYFPSGCAVLGNSHDTVTCFCLA